MVMFVPLNLSVSTFDLLEYVLKLCFGSSDLLPNLKTLDQRSYLFIVFLNHHFIIIRDGVLELLNQL
jgi:hypothetical protein